MIWLIAVGVLAISSAAILIRLTPADPIAITFWRLAISTLIVLSTAALRPFKMPSGSALVMSTAAGVLLAIHFLSWIPSLFLTTVAASTTLVNIHPVFMLFLSRAVGERVNLQTAVGVLTATAGAVTVTLTPGGLLGNLLALVGALSFAGYLTLGRLARAAVGTLSYVVVAYGTAALTALAVGAAAGVNLIHYDMYTFAMFLLIASVPMMLGHTIFNYLLGRYRAVTIAASTLGEPVGATLLAALILGEVPTGWTQLGPLEVPLLAVGIAATLTGVAMVIWEEIKIQK